MPSTYEPIQILTPSGVTDFTFTSIPQTYTDLILVINGSPIGGGVSMDSNIRFNGDSGSSYSDTRYQNSGGDRSNNATSARTGAPGGSSRYISIIHINNYTNTSKNKSGISRSGTTDSGQSVVEMYSFTWRNTAAITSLTMISGQSRTYGAGTVATLYGVKVA